MKEKATHLIKNAAWDSRCGTNVDYDGSMLTFLIEDTTCKNCIRLYKSDIEKEHRGFTRKARA